jgi:holo-[acyl-carrier protein] synthase
MSTASIAQMSTRVELAAGRGVLPGTAHVGVDLVEIQMLTRLLQAGGARLSARWFTPAETAFCAGEHDRLAATLAGKEATAKLLGTGFRAGVRWTDIEVLRHSDGAPYVVLRGGAHRRAQKLCIASIAISLCHEGPFAVAVASGVPR